MPSHTDSCQWVVFSLVVLPTRLPQNGHCLLVLHFIPLMQPVYIATIVTATSGFFCLELLFAVSEHLYSGRVRPLSRSGIRRKRREEGKIAYRFNPLAGSQLMIAFRYVGIWMGIRQMGPLVGGAISLAINVNTAHTGKVSYNTYLGLVAISSLGAPFALLLSQPQDVVRSNGTKIPYMKKTSLAIEARAIWKQLKNKYLLLLIPVFLAGQFGTTYQGNYLTSMIYPIPIRDQLF